MLLDQSTPLIDQKSPQIQGRAVVEDATRKPSLVRSSSSRVHASFQATNSPIHPSAISQAQLSKTFPQPKAASTHSIHPESKAPHSQAMYAVPHAAMSSSINSGQDIVALHQHILANSVSSIPVVAVHRPAIVRVRSVEQGAAFPSGVTTAVPIAAPEPTAFRTRVVPVPSQSEQEVCSCCRHMPSDASPVRIPARRILPRLPQAASFPQDQCYVPPPTLLNVPVSPSSHSPSVSDVSPSLFGSPDRLPFRKSFDHSPSPGASLKFPSPPQVFAVISEREPMMLPAAEPLYPSSPMRPQGSSTGNRFRMPLGTKPTVSGPPHTPIISASPSPSPSPLFPSSQFSSPSPVPSPSQPDDFDGMQTADWVHLLRSYRTLIQSPSQ